MQATVGAACLFTCSPAARKAGESKSHQEPCEDQVPTTHAGVSLRKVVYNMPFQVYAAEAPCLAPQLLVEAGLYTALFRFVRPPSASPAMGVSPHNKARFCARETLSATSRRKLSLATFGWWRCKGSLVKPPAHDAGQGMGHSHYPAE